MSSAPPSPSPTPLSLLRPPISPAPALRQGVALARAKANALALIVYFFASNSGLWRAVFVRWARGAGWAGEVVSAVATLLPLLLLFNFFQALLTIVFPPQPTPANAPSTPSTPFSPTAPHTPTPLSPAQRRALGFANLQKSSPKTRGSPVLSPELPIMPSSPGGRSGSPLKKGGAGVGTPSPAGAVVQVPPNTPSTPLRNFLRQSAGVGAGTSGTPLEASVGGGKREGEEPGRELSPQRVWMERHAIRPRRIDGPELERLLKNLQ